MTNTVHNPTAARVNGFGLATKELCSVHEEAFETTLGISAKTTLVYVELGILGDSFRGVEKMMESGAGEEKNVEKRRGKRPSKTRKKQEALPVELKKVLISVHDELKCCKVGLRASRSP